MREWATINGRRKRWQDTRRTGGCCKFSFIKVIKKVVARFKFSHYNREEL